MSHENQQLEYQGAAAVAAIRRKRLAERAVLLGALLFAAFITFSCWAEWRFEFDQWRDARALKKSLRIPASKRFPAGKLIYAVPSDFGRDVALTGTSSYGTVAAESVAAAAEMRRFDAGFSDPAPMVFLGGLDGSMDGRVLVAIGFSRCTFHDQSVALTGGRVLDAGYHLIVSYSVVTTRRSAFSQTQQLQFAPLSAVNRQPEWRDGQIVPIPLAFYGSYVHPDDSSTAVIPIQLAGLAGRLLVTMKENPYWPEYRVEWE